jgi:transcriptional regulator with XRE-family HTH domain
LSSNEVIVSPFLEKVKGFFKKSQKNIAFWATMCYTIGNESLYHIENEVPMMKIGEKIRLRRMEQGMSLQDLADRMGYANKSTVARIESGEIDPPQSKVVKFADALGTSVSDLMGWLDEENEKPAVQGELSDKVKQLVDFALSVPEDKIDLVLKVMKSIVEDD